MLRIFAYAAAFACLVFAGAAGARPYKLTDLGNLGYGESFAYGMNDAGAVVGFVENPDGQTAAFLYESGTTGNLGIPEGWANDINNAGQVAGWQTNTPGSAFLYSGGAVRFIGTFGGPSNSAFGINDAGQVVGSADSSDRNTYAFLYSNGVLTNLGSLAGQGYGSEAYAINNVGQVTGISDAFGENGLVQDAFLYSHGVMTDLGALNGGFLTYGTALNDFGDVVGVGYFYQSGGTNIISHAFLDHDGTMIDLGTLPGELSSTARGINDRGQIVGYGDGGAFIYQDGVMTNLNTLVVNGSGWALGDAEAINASGQIAGTGIHNGVPEAFLLTPLPEPSTWSLMIGGLALAGAALRRRNGHVAGRFARCELRAPRPFPIR
jgi:probable HAF family extracellular repeat protein